MIAAYHKHLYLYSRSLHHDPSIDDENGMTVAMYLTATRQRIPEEWEHRATRQTMQGWTVAMIAAQYKCLHLLSKHWYHSPTLTNSKGETVAMIAAEYGHIDIISNHWNHDPLLCNSRENTVASIAA